MLHQCHRHGDGGGGVAAPCSCGFIHGTCSGGGAAFSILFPMAGCGNQTAVSGDPGNMSLSPSAVDCTLSLGTPSTRHSEKSSSSAKSDTNHTTCVPSFCWDILSSSKHSSSSSTTINIGARGTPASNAICSSNLSGDPMLLARRCANCDTTSTPLWRNGPRGPKSLCNACGIRYKKEERRAAASTAVAEQVTGYGGYQRPAAAQQPWGCYATAKASPGKGGPAPFSMSFAGNSGSRDDSRPDEEGDDVDVPYLSWRLNVMPSTQFPVRDRPSLFQFQ